VEETDALVPHLLTEEEETDIPVDVEINQMDLWKPQHLFGLYLTGVEVVAAAEALDFVSAAAPGQDMVRVAPITAAAEAAAELAVSEMEA
jgi:hypothetical protein